MGGIILIASIIIWALGYFPVNEDMDEAQRQENSYIGKIGKFIEPVLEPLGFDWKLGISIFTGVAAKEIVVSTMGVLYHSESENTESLSQRLISDKSSTPLTPYSAYGFMIFILIYFPCVATATAMIKEAGQKRWAIISIVYSIATAWLLAFLINQIGKLL